ncbi:hypothetical protein SNEBB_008092 [Seison nebaliae]|nr:hypothetical protein SNEBB_008092 [Seison nebaliae]
MEIEEKYSEEAYQCLLNCCKEIGIDLKDLTVAQLKKAAFKHHDFIQLCSLLSLNRVKGNELFTQISQSTSSNNPERIVLLTRLLSHLSIHFKSANKFTLGELLGEKPQDIPKIPDLQINDKPKKAIFNEPQIIPPVIMNSNDSLSELLRIQWLHTLHSNVNCSMQSIKFIEHERNQLSRKQSVWNRNNLITQLNSFNNDPSPNAIRQVFINHQLKYLDELTAKLNLDNQSVQQLSISALLIELLNYSDKFMKMSSERFNQEISNLKKMNLQQLQMLQMIDKLLNEIIKKKPTSSNYITSNNAHGKSKSLDDVVESDNLDKTVHNFTEQFMKLSNDIEQINDQSYNEIDIFVGYLSTQAIVYLFSDEIRNLNNKYVATTAEKKNEILSLNEKNENLQKNMNDYQNRYGHLIHCIEKLHNEEWIIHMNRVLDKNNDNTDNLNKHELVVDFLKKMRDEHENIILDKQALEKSIVSMETEYKKKLDKLEEDFKLIQVENENLTKSLEQLKKVNEEFETKTLARENKHFSNQFIQTEEKSYDNTLKRKINLVCEELEILKKKNNNEMIQRNEEEKKTNDYNSLKKEIHKLINLQEEQKGELLKDRQQERFVVEKERLGERS